MDKMQISPWDNQKPKRKVPPPPPNKRRLKRRTMHYPAWIAFDSGRQVVNCVIRDMSDGGARLMITFPVGLLPDTFNLWLDKNGKVQRECELVWKQPPYLGVRFTPLQRRGTDRRFSALTSKRGE